MLEILPQLSGQLIIKAVQTSEKVLQVETENTKLANQESTADLRIQQCFLKY